MGGWRAVSAAGLKGKGPGKSNVSFTGTYLSQAPTPVWGMPGLRGPGAARLRRDARRVPGATAVFVLEILAV